MRKYTKEVLSEAVLDCLTISDVCLKFGKKVRGGSHSYFSKLIKQYEIDISHFQSDKASQVANLQRRKYADDYLVYRPNDNKRTRRKLLYRSLIERGVEYCCSECGQQPFHNNKELTLQIDHINGDFLDDRQENLRFLCPNCHTQTPTYAKKNIPMTQGAGAIS